MPVGSISLIDSAVLENNNTYEPLTIVIERSGGTDPFSVVVSTADGTARAGSDYVALPPTTVSFAAGELFKFVTATILGDTVFEPNETFFANLSNATSGGVIVDSQSIVEIRNDDRSAPALDTWRLASHTVTSPTTTANRGSSTEGGGFATDRSLVFHSSATDLLPGVTSLHRNLVLYDVETGTRTLVNHAADNPNVVSNATFGVSALAVGMSSDGRYLLYGSNATNLVPGQVDSVPAFSSSGYDLFIYDQVTNTSALVSHLAAGATTASNGDGGLSGQAFFSSMSADGRYVAYESRASAVVAGQIDGAFSDVFLYDRTNGTNILVSHTAGNPTTAANDIGNTKLSRNGDFIAFISKASNLVPGQVDTNQSYDVFVYDVAAGTTKLVTHAAGSAATAASVGAGADEPTILAFSPDGRYLLLESAATNLFVGQVDPGSPRNLFRDVFVYDIQTDTMARVIHSFSSPAFTADSRSVVFDSMQGDLVPGQVDTNGRADVFVYDIASGTTSLVSHIPGNSTTTGAASTLAGESSGNRAFSAVATTASADGRYIVYQSAADNLVTGQTEANTGTDIFLYDRQTETTTLVSHAFGSPTTTGNRPSFVRADFLGGSSPKGEISPDGRFVLFESFANNLVSGTVGSAGEPNVYLYEIATDQMWVVAAAAGAVHFSPDSRHIVYSGSTPFGFTGNDTDSSTFDVFIADVPGAAAPPAPTLTIAAADAAKAEGNTSSTPFTFTVTRSGDTTGASTVAYAVTGSGANPASAADFAGGVLPSGSVPFAAGEIAKVISIAVAGDTAIETNEGFTVTLSGATGATIATAAASGTISNDDVAVAPVVSVALAPPSANEGGSFTLTASRTGTDLSQATTITYTLTGAAANASDISSPLTGTITIPANLASASLQIATVQDTIVEPDEAFTVTASNPVNGTLSTATATATIVNDDVVAPVAGSVSVSDVSISEGDAGTKVATFTLTRSGGTAAFNVDYATANGSATAGSDYAAANGSASFAAGVDTATVSVTISGDTTVEPDETFLLNLSNATGGATIADAQATGTILNDDAVTPVAGSVTVPDVSITEGDAGTKVATFTLTRSGGTAAFNVDYATANGSATAGSDYAAASGTASFAAGIDTATVTVTINGDTAVEPDETFLLNLSNATVGATITDAQATGTILNDDAAGDTIAPTAALLTSPPINTPLGGNGSVIAIQYSDNVAVDFTTVDNQTRLDTRVVNTATGFVGNPIRFTSAPLDFPTYYFLDAPGGTWGAEDNGTYEIFINANEVADTSGNFVAAGKIGEFTVGLASTTPVVSIALAPSSANEGGSFALTATRTGADLSQATTITYTLTGAAANASDISSPLTGTITIPANQTSAPLSIATVQDTAVEPDEAFTVTATNPVNGTLGTATATATIVNDDVASPPPTLSIAVTDASKPEGNAGTTDFTFTLTRSGDTTGTSTVAYAVTGSGASAADSADFAGGVLPSGSVSFAIGETSKVVHIAVAGDTSVEPSESFTVTLSGATGATIATAAASGTIGNDDAIAPVAGSVAVSDVSITEGNAGTKVATFTLTRTGGTAAFTVDYATANGTATAGSDYASASGTASFAAGIDTATVGVTITGDTTVEPDETFLLNLSNATGGATIGDAQATGTITNDDVAAPVAGSVSVADVSISEGDAGTKVATFTLTRSGGTAAFSVDASSADGTATAGSDYGALPLTTVSFAAGETTRTVNVTVNGDTAVETDETFTVNLTNATNGAAIADGQGLGTITNDDAVAPVAGSVAIGDVTIAEGNAGASIATFTLTRSGGTAAFSVDYATANGSATAGSDYAATSGASSFAAGINTATVSVTINGDTTVEPDETFLLNLSNATGGATIADGQATGTITNDDAPVAGSVAINDVSITEGDAGTKVATFTLTRTGGTAAFNVDYTTANGTATAGSDYAAASGTASFAAGIDTATVSVTITGDTTVEPDETFLLNLSNATGGATIADAQATGTITNDDAIAPGKNVITGTDCSEVLKGTNAADVITALGGNDRVFAKDGDDCIIATKNDGCDYYDGGRGSDTIDYSDLTQGVNVKLGALLGIGTGYASGRQNGTDVLVSIENVIGSQVGDRLHGNKLANVIEGGSGDDTLTGGGGSDTFVFKPGFGNDRITDFDANPCDGQDLIELSGFGINANNFACRVSIADVCADTLVTIDGDAAQTIRLVGIGSATTINVDDFRFS